MRRHFRPRTWAPWIAAAIALALTAAPLLFGLRYFGWDLTLNDMGYLCELKRRLAAGDPLWLSPLIGNGSPLLIDPAAQLFYPPRWLMLLLPVELGTSAIVVFHVAVAAGAVTWLVRGHGVRPTFAIGAGLACALSGVVLDTTVHSVYAVSASWQAMAWAAGRQLARRPHQRRWFVVTTLALCASLLGGEPQSFAIGCALVLLEAWRARRSPLPTRARRLGLAAVSAGLAFAMAAALWLPALAELALTPRFGSLASGMATLCSFRAQYWIGLIAPGVFTEPLTSGRYLWEVATGSSGAGVAGDIWNRTPYLGPLFLTLALLGSGRRRAGSAAIVAALGLLLALGDQTPLFRWAATVFPPLGFFRYPAKYLVVTALAAAVLLGHGLEGIVRSAALRRCWQRGAAVALVALLVAIGQVLWRRGWFDGLDAAAIAGGDGPTVSTLIATALAQGAAPLAAALALSSLPGRWRHGVAGALVLDLVLAAAGSVGLGAGLASLQSPLVGALGRPGDPPVVCHHGDVKERRLTVAGAPADWSMQALHRLLVLPNLNTCDGLATGFGYTVFASGLQLRLEHAITLGLPAAGHALGCDTLVTLYPTPDETAHEVTLPGFGGVDSAGNALRVYALGDPIARALLVQQPLWFDDDDSVYQHIVASAAAVQILRAVDDPVRRQPAPAALPAGVDVGALEIDWPRRDRATVAAAGHGGAVIGLRTLFLRGWSARQAGRELRVVRVGGNFVGAVVDDVTAGPIAFSYRPPRLVAGVLASAIGWLLLLAIAGSWRTLCPTRGRRA